MTTVTLWPLHFCFNSILLGGENSVLATLMNDTYKIWQCINVYQVASGWSANNTSNKLLYTYACAQRSKIDK